MAAAGVSLSGSSTKPRLLPASERLCRLRSATAVSLSRRSFTCSLRKSPVLTRVNVSASGLEAHSAINSSGGTIEGDLKAAGGAVDGTPLNDGDASKAGVRRRRGAMLHDFCLGIPFGWFLVGGGLLRFVMEGNLSYLRDSLLYGGIVLTLNFIGLRFWKIKGRSSWLALLGQAAVAGIIARENIQSYTLTKRMFPAGVYAFISAVMLCFYAYVVISGGNRPPKKWGAAPPSQH